MKSTWHGINLDDFYGKNLVRLYVEPEYTRLMAVLYKALLQAQSGKGKERHANGEPFEDQPIVWINKQLGSEHGAVFQACKKAMESARLEGDAKIREILGAINYLAAAVILIEGEIKNKKQGEN